MESLTSCCCIPYVVAGVALFVAAYYYLSPTLKKLNPSVRRDFPSNTVVLRQLGRGPFAPSMSPYPIKLETYLRIAKIPYVSDHTSGMSSKGKTPWISLNNEDVADSQFSIEYLNKKFDVDLNKHLSEQDKAVARAFRKLTEEGLYWSMLAVRWGPFEYKATRDLLKKSFGRDMPSLLLKLVTRWIRQALNGQGTGRHSPAEVEQIANGDLLSISTYLGQKDFLMGSEPCVVDCALFGMLAQCKWQMPDSPHEKFVTETYPNLNAYCERIKERFWPDWEECITHDGTTTPTKYNS